MKKIIAKVLAMVTVILLLGIISISQSPLPHDGVAPERARTMRIVFRSLSAATPAALSFFISSAYAEDNRFTDNVIVDGNVGIGTTAPGTKLVVDGTISTTHNSGINNVTNVISALASDGAVIKLGTNRGGFFVRSNADGTQEGTFLTLVTDITQSATSGGSIAYTNTNNTVRGMVYYQSPDGHEFFAQPNTSSGVYTPTSLMKIKYTGNVGIGTADPGNFKLNVNGPMNVDAITATSISNLSTLTVTGNTYLATSTGNVGIGTTGPGATLDVERIANDSGNILNIGTLGGGQFNFVRLASTGALSVQGTQAGFNNIVLVPTSGNVGIGTVSPAQKLHVEGQCVTGDTLLPVIRVGSRVKGQGSRVKGEGGMNEISIRRSESLARGNGTDRENLQNNKGFSTFGKIWDNFADTTFCGFNCPEYSRGKRQVPQEGIQAISLQRKGFSLRGQYTDSAFKEAGLFEGERISGNSPEIRTNNEPIEWIDKLSKGRLTHSPYTLDPTPYTLHPTPYTLDPIYIPITEVHPGDYVLSLNEETGRIEPHRINALLDMGVKPVFKLTTKDGKTIKTTGNHPYLVKGEVTEGQRITIAQQRIESLTRESNLQTKDFSAEYEFSQPKPLWLLSEENEKGKDLTADFSFQSSDALVHINSQTKFFLERTNLISENSNFLINILDLLIQPFNLSAQLAKSSCGFSLQGSNLPFDNSQLRSNNVLESFFNTFINTRWHYNLLAFQLKDTIHKLACQAQNRNLAYASIPNYMDEAKADWLKVIYLKPGDEIAVWSSARKGALALREDRGSWIVDRGIPSSIIHHTSSVSWSRIASIEYIGYEQVYDIEVEGTHNFIAGHWINETTVAKDRGSWIVDRMVDRGSWIVDRGNPPSTIHYPRSSAEGRFFGGIIAHNTYLNGSVGIGTANPLSTLSFGSTVAFIAPDSSVGSDNKRIIIAGAPDYANNNRGAIITIMGSSYSGREGDLNLYAANSGVSGHGYISFSTGAMQERIRIDSSGNVGIGTVSPAQKLHVEGQCVTGDTLLLLSIFEQGVQGSRFKVQGDQKDPADPFKVQGSRFKETAIKDVKPGMMVYSLNEELGIVEPHRILALLDMGVKPVFKLTTKDGKTIKTTGNHPYLVVKKGDKDREEVAARRIRSLESRYGLSGQSLRLDRDISEGRAIWIDRSVQKSSSLSSQQYSRRQGYVFAEVIPGLSVSLKGESLRDSNLLDNSGAQEIYNQGTTTRIIGSGISGTGQISRADQLYEQADWTEITPSELVQGSMFKVQGEPEWTKVIYLVPGDLIAVSSLDMDFKNKGNSNGSLEPRTLNLERYVLWAEIESIEYVGYEQVYDISVEGTQNFFGNGILAHNTYLNGNVGIGTTSPGGKLEVYGNAGTWAGIPSILLHDTYSSSSRTWGLYQGVGGTGSLNFRVSSAENGDPGSTGTTMMLIDSNGNVGIGTTGPGYALQVNSGKSDDPYLQAYFNSTMATGYGGIGVNGINQSHVRFFINGSQKWQIAAGMAAATDALGIYSWTKADYVMYFKNDGNVGIGTTSPVTKLDIPQNFAIKVGQAYLSSGGDYTHLANNEWYNGSAWASNGSAGVLYQQTGTNNYWYTHNGAGTHTTRMTLDGSGNLAVTGTISEAGTALGSKYVPLAGNVNITGGLNIAGSVGIGTTGPRWKLDVSGGRLGVDNNQWIVGRNAANNGDIGIAFIDTSNRVNIGGGDTVLINPSTGNVGIGTTGPGARLDVKATTGAVANFNNNTTVANAVVTIGNSQTWGLLGATNYSGQLIFTALSQNWSSINTASLIGGLTNTVGGAEAGALAFYTYGSGSLSEKMRISSTGGLSIGSSYVGTDPGAGNMIITGNVGIGTTSPTARLEVNAPSGTLASKITSCGSADIMEMWGGTTPKKQYAFQYDASADPDALLRMYANDGSTVKIQLYAAGNNYFNGGSVGIGTTAPTTALDVRGGVLRSNTRVSSAENYPVGRSFIDGESIFTIDPSWSQVELQEYFGSSGVSWVADSTAPAGYAIQITGAVCVGGEYDSGFPYIPVESGGVYYMECWLKSITANQNHYMGSNEYNENFTSLGGNPGSYGYWVMSSTAIGTSWTKVSAYISGFDATAVGKFELGTKYWTPMALFNYGTAGTSYISGWKITKVNMKGNRVFDGNVGIGTTAPTANLDVIGTIKGSSTVTATTFSGNLSGYKNIDSGNECTIANGYGGGVVYLNYRGVSGSGITDFRICNGLATGTLAPISCSTVTATTFYGALSGSLTTSGPIYRSAAGAGYLNGQYSGVESTTTSGAIYSIGGTYVPGTTTLGNMYGIGYGYSGGGGITFSGLPVNLWGMYVASNGIPSIFLSSGDGKIYATSGIFSGSVGIGTTAPYRRLSVVSSNNSISALEVKAATNIVAGKGNPAASIAFTAPNYADGYNLLAAIAAESGDNTYADRGQLAFKTGYMSILECLTTRMVIDCNGNVGIGTATPDQVLHVAGNISLGRRAQSAVTRYFGLTDNTGAFSSGDGVGTAGMIIDQAVSGDADIYFKTGVWGSQESKKVVIKGSGNVGIGIAAPGTLLNIANNGDNAVLRLENTGGGDSATQTIGAIQFYRDEIDVGPSVRAQIVGYSQDGPDRDSELQFWTKPISGSMAQSMVIDHSGSVGIGTTGPSTLLSLGNSLGMKLAVYDGGTPAGSYGFGIQSGRMFAQNSAGNEVMVWTSGGSVGIGTTAPDYKLDVAGTIRNRISVSGSPYTDARIMIYGGPNVDATNYAYLGYGNDANMRIVYRNTTQPYALYIGSATGYDGTGVFTPEMTVKQGNVGIGTAAPTASLDVAGNKGSTDNRNFKVTYPAGGGLANTELSGLTHLSSELGLAWTALYAKQGSASYALVANGTSYFTGNVGIGTTAPAAKLDVSGDAYMNKVLQHYSSWGTTGDGGAAIVNDNGTYQALMIVGNSSAGGLRIIKMWDNVTVNGTLTVTGYIYKNGGGFQIDHPLDPANKVLMHSFVESPDMKNLYDGVVILNENGESTIELPDWFGALNRDFRYQLTPIGKPGMPYVKEEIKDNKFIIAGDPGMKVSWQVTGTRQDAYAEKNRIKVEEEKGSRDGLVKKGEYLAKDCYGEKE